MEGSITARPLDYFGLLVAASIVALVSAVKSGMSELEQALEALGARAECVGPSGFTTREDVLLATASSDAAKLVKGA